MASMGNVLGLIFANMHEENLPELTKARAMASVPFGARYRLVDFPLSSMVNSGITQVGIITQAKYYSLMDHLGMGSEWDLARKTGGLHILPPYGRSDNGVYRGRLRLSQALRNSFMNPARSMLSCPTAMLLRTLISSR